MGTAHPSAETWSLYLEGWLTPAEVEGLESHLVTCETCRQQVEVARSQREAKAGVDKPSRVVAAPLTAADGRATEKLLPEIPSVPIVIPRQWGPVVALVVLAGVALIAGAAWLFSASEAEPVAEPAAVVVAQPPLTETAPFDSALEPDSGGPDEAAVAPTTAETAPDDAGPPAAETAPDDAGPPAAEAGLLAVDAGQPPTDSGTKLVEPAPALARPDASLPAGLDLTMQLRPDAGGPADAGSLVRAKPPERPPRPSDAGVPRVTAPRAPTRRPAAPPPVPSNDPLDDWH
jgi:hypothetical protein